MVIPTTTLKGQCCYPHICNLSCRCNPPYKCNLSLLNWTGAFENFWAPAFVRIETYLSTLPFWRGDLPVLVYISLSPPGHMICIFDECSSAPLQNSSLEIFCNTYFLFVLQLLIQKTPFKRCFLVLYITQ